MNIKEWQEKINKWAEEKGWNEDLNETPDSIGKQITNMHSELSEAWEEIKNGSTPTDCYDKTDDRGYDKPEGFGIELADCVIRLLHTCEFYKYQELEERVKLWEGILILDPINETPDNIGKHLAEIHVLISDAWGWVDKDYTCWAEFLDGLATCVAYIRLLCKGLGIDLEKMMEIKQSYNETRSYRHGGKKA